MADSHPRRARPPFAAALAALVLGWALAGGPVEAKAPVKGEKAAASKIGGSKAEPVAKPKTKAGGAAAKTKLVAPSASKAKTEAKAKSPAEKKGGEAGAKTKLAAESKVVDSKVAKAAAAKTDAKSKVAKAEAKSKAAKADAESKTAKADAKSERAAGAKTAAADKATSKSGAERKAQDPVYGAARAIKVKLRKGETLTAALRRAEVAPEDAATAAAKAQAALDGGAEADALRAGRLFTVEVAPREGRANAGRVMKLTLGSGADATAVLSRAKGGALTAKPQPQLARSEKIKTAAKDTDEETAPVKTARESRRRDELVRGEVRGSLYGSAAKAGVGGGHIREIVRAFAAKLDFERDLQAGDPFRVVFDGRETEGAKVVRPGNLLYAEIKAKGRTTRLYRFARRGGEVVWLDENGRGLKGGLLRTPIEGARMSSGYGMRLHPILGFHKMHQGVDFAAAAGVAVLAAGDGVVTRVERWGGYGNWLQIRHAGGYESGYAHLSRYASGLRVGSRVHQGQTVAFVGSTGRSTGPHLHHEIWLNGRRIDPRGARVPAGLVLDGAELVAFNTQKKAVLSALASPATRPQFAARPAKAKVAARAGKGEG